LSLFTGDDVIVNQTGIAPYDHACMVGPAVTPSVRTDTTAVVSLVLAVLSLPALVFPPLLGLGVAAIVTGVIARRRVLASAGVLKGEGIATAGIVVGVLGTLLGLVLPGFVVAVWIYAIFHGNQIPYGQ
jgi:uncharacterized membrane protein YqaE (UPF0057 family)